MHHSTGRWCRTPLSTIFLAVLGLGFILFSTTYLYGIERIKPGEPESTAKSYFRISKSPDNPSHESSAGGKRNVQSLTSYKIQKQMKTISSVCKRPKMDLYSESVKDLFHKVPLLNCSGQNLLILQNGVLHINESALRGKKLKRCEYRIIGRSSDSYFEYSTTVTRESPPFVIRVKHDFFRVQCFLHYENRGKGKPTRRGLLSTKSINSSWLENIINETKVNLTTENQNKTQVSHSAKELIMQAVSNTTHTNKLSNLSDDDYVYEVEEADYDQIFAQVHPKEKAILRTKSKQLPQTATRLNVLMLGLDSMSHLSYQRKLPKTYRYLRDTIRAVILQGYNVVGDATTANMIPLLTGKTEQELPEVRRNYPEAADVDVYPLLFYTYRHVGYVTLFAEDEPSLGMFNLRLNGFKKAPADHYMRPFWQSVWDSSLNEMSKRFCLGPRTKHSFTLDYLRDFFRNYKTFPKFAFTFHGELSHGDVNFVEYLDIDLLKFLKLFRKLGYLNNTVLVLFSDHGSRYSKVRHTLQGKLEERLPFMSLAFPEWFEKKYPDWMKNMRKNVNRITTPFDVYETLIDLIEGKRSHTKKGTKGVSLFRSISSNRSCKLAGIETHWCTCLTWKPITVDNAYVRQCALAIVRYINFLTTEHRNNCSKLILQNVLSSYLVMPPTEVLMYMNSNDDDHRIPNFFQNVTSDIMDYQVTIETAPNKGIFEATVRVDLYNEKYDIRAEISRLDRYADQASCVSDSYPDLRKFCLCNDYLKRVKM